MAYFAPYTTDRHTQLVAEIGAMPGARLESLGRSLDGRELDLLTIGGSAGPCSPAAGGAALRGAVGAWGAAQVPHQRLPACSLPAQQTVPSCLPAAAGEPGPGKLAVWVTARQHPGETMAEWAAEGLLRRLTDPADAAARRLLNSTVWYVVPNM